MPRIRVSGLLRRGDSILFIQHLKSDRRYYLLPGGGAEDHETLEDALQREFLEELAMRVKVGPLLMVTQNISPDKQRNIVQMVFLVESKDDPRVNPAEERLSGYLWYDTITQEKVDFYPDVLPHLLELISRSAYNGPVVVHPAWV